MSLQSPDMVNSPSHYQLDGLEAIDIIKASLTADEYLGYLKGNALKYMLREPFKGNSKQDVAKAQWYLERYHALVEFRDKKVKRNYLDSRTKRKTISTHGN